MGRVSVVPFGHMNDSLGVVIASSVLSANHVSDKVSPMLQTSPRSQIIHALLSSLLCTSLRDCRPAVVPLLADIMETWSTQ